MLEFSLEKILIVDDNPNIPQSIEREFYEEYDIFKANSGQEALTLIEKEGPFTIIVSDMRMPEMDGITFLTEAGKKDPSAIKIMLTGNSGLDTAISAVNEGNIFRFLTKPCPLDLLRKVLEDSVNQHHMQTDHKKLLRDTFVASINLLVNIISITRPEVYKKSLRIRKIAAGLAKAMMLRDAWIYESAAMLSLAGCIALPDNILNKILKGETMSGDEEVAFNAHPLTGHSLLMNIPRMEQVAEMIKFQNKGYQELVQIREIQHTSAVILGATIIRLSEDIDSMKQKGFSNHSILSYINGHKERYHPKIVEIANRPGFLANEKMEEEIRIYDFDKGMELCNDIVDENNRVIISKGTRHSLPLRNRLIELHEKNLVGEKIFIRRT